MPRARNAPLAKGAPTIDSQSTRRALKEKTNTERTKTKAGAQDGDSSDKFVKTARTTRQRGKQALQDESMLVMTGGLGTTRKAETTHSKSSRGNAVPKATVAGPRPSTGKSPPVKAAQIPPPSSPPRSAAPFDLNAQPADFSPSPSPPPARQSSQKMARPSFRPPGSAARTHEASALVENSLLALRNFKRRPRQPSMLQMVQQRRASAQPSAFGNSDMTGANAGLELPGDDDIEDLYDDFMPEAAGTPLQMRQGSWLSGGNGQGVRQVKNPRKRNSGQGSSFISEPGESARKRSKMSTPQSSSTASYTSALSALRAGSSTRREAPSPIVLVENSQPIEDVAPTSTSSLSSPPPAQSPENDPPSATRLGSQPRTTASSPRETRATNDDDIASTDTFADPLSSSPPPAGSHVSATQGTDIMADPMTQISPPRPAARTRGKVNDSKPLSTSTLQALLPRRRQQPRRQRRVRRNTDFDIESDEVEGGEHGARTGPGDESDEDELNSHPPLRRTLTQKSARKSKAASKSRKSKPAVVKPAARSRKSTKQPRTYGRCGGGTSDKENAGRNAADTEKSIDLPSEDEDEDAETSFLPDTSLTMAEVSAQSDELAEARKKFAAVDDWDLDFESVSRHEEAGSGSSQLWR